MSRKNRPLIRPEYNNWQDEGKSTWWDWLAVALVIVITAVMVAFSQGCATTDPPCRPECCAGCAPVVKELDCPPKPILVIQPEVDVPPDPVLESIDNWEVVKTDPNVWKRLLGQDFKELREAFKAAKQELIDLNEARKAALAELEAPPE